MSKKIQIIGYQISPTSFPRSQASMWSVAWSSLLAHGAVGMDQRGRSVSRWPRLRGDGD